MKQNREGMMFPLKLPVGIDNFEKIRTRGFYYVDKTGLIKELLYNWGEVNLFIRPRRFGKSLNMSILKTFFEYGQDKTLFEGLEIAGEKELCQKYMGNFPVIVITMKDIESRDYEGARAAMCSVIGNEALRFQFLMESDRLTEKEKVQYSQLIKIDSENLQGFAMSEEVLKNSLFTLSKLLCKHYGQKVILLRSICQWRGRGYRGTIYGLSKEDYQYPGYGRLLSWNSTWTA